MIPVADKMQPGRFTIRFNMNDPQQRAAVEILNRLENTASVVYSGASIAAPPVSTLLLLPPLSQ